MGALVASAVIAFLATACSSPGVDTGRGGPGQASAADGAEAQADVTLPTTAPGPSDTVIAPPPEHFDGPAATAAPPASLASGRFGKVAPSGGTWAVMIGINNYPGSNHDLRSAVADANDVDEALSRMGVPSDHRLVIRDGQATAGVITMAADWLVAHAGPDAVAVYFYAGHVRKLASSTEAIIAADGRAVTDATLGEHLRPLRAAHAWIGIAACYGGGFTETLAAGRILTAAAGANSLAYENASFGRSYMVQFMVREAMIDQRAPGSVQDAFVYARAAIAKDHPGREPVQLDRHNGPLSLRPPGSPTPPARPAPAQSPPPQPAPRPAAPSSGSASSPSTTSTTSRCGGVANPLGVTCR